MNAVGCAGDGMSAVMFENILKELSNLISENDLHVSQVCTVSVYPLSVLFVFSQIVSNFYVHCNL